MKVSIDLFQPMTCMKIEKEIFGSACQVVKSYPLKKHCQEK
jgi:hypothetical protein